MEQGKKFKFLVFPGLWNKVEEIWGRKFLPPLSYDKTLSDSLSDTMKVHNTIATGKVSSRQRQHMFVGLFFYLQDHKDLMGWLTENCVTLMAFLHSYQTRILQSFKKNRGSTSRCSNVQK